jgi:hypothetical protein
VINKVVKVDKIKRNINLRIIMTIITLIILHIKKATIQKKEVLCIVQWTTSLFLVLKQTAPYDQV